MKDNILFIVNPVSGNKPKEFVLKLIDKKFEGGEYNVKTVITNYAGEATSIVKDFIKKGYNRVVAVGGDGTVNEVASAVADTDAALGIIPLGSGNGLARHLKIPMKPSRAIDLVKVGKSGKIDYGKINDQKFFCTSGVGFDAHVGHLFSKMEGRGVANYIKATLSEFRQYQPSRYEISMNGAIIMRDAFLITFANASQYGNNAHIAPNADIRDGKLEIAIMRGFPLIKAPGVGTRLFLKNINKSVYVETYQSTNVIIKRTSPGVIHFDGEPTEMGELLNIKIIPGGLKVIAPLQNS